MNRHNYNLSPCRGRNLYMHLFSLIKWNETQKDYIFLCSIRCSIKDTNQHITSVILCVVIIAKVRSDMQVIFHSPLLFSCLLPCLNLFQSSSLCWVNSSITLPSTTAQRRDKRVFFCSIFISFYGRVTDRQTPGGYTGVNVACMEAAILFLILLSSLIPLTATPKTSTSVNLL